MCRDSDFVNDLCHIGFQIMLGQFFRFLVGIDFANLLRFCLRMMFYGFDPVDDHIIVKWLHNVVIRTQIKRILCYLLLTDRTDHNKSWMFLNVFVVIDTIQYSQTIQLWHHNIKQYDIRLFCFYHMVCFFPIFCGSYHIQFVITFDNISQ